MEPTREASTASSTTTTAHTAASKATTSHLASEHLEQHFRINLRAHAASHAAKATAAELFMGVDKVFAAVVGSAFLRVREGFIGFTNVLEAVGRCFITLVL